MFPLWSDDDGGLAASNHGGVPAQAGSRSDAGGAVLSKQIKLEAMVILKHGDKASRESAMASSMDAGVPCDKPVMSGECTPPVCVNASERVNVDLVDCASKNADVSSLVMLSQDVKKLNADVGGDLSKLGTSDVLVVEPDGASNPVEFNENPVVRMELGSMSAVEPDGGIYEEQDQSCEDSQISIIRCSLPVCGNAHSKSGGPDTVGVSVDRAESGEVVAHGAKGNRIPPVCSSTSMIGGVAVFPSSGAPAPVFAGALGGVAFGGKSRGNNSQAPSVVEGPHGLLPIAELSLAQEFRPPKPGVVLQEWVKVAKDKRRGKKSVLTAVVGEQCSGAAALPLAYADPFPPVSKVMGSNAGLAGSSVAAAGMLDEINNGKQNQEGEVNNFTWSDLLRSRKPTSVGIDMHFVEPTIIDGDPCAVFTIEEEAENMLNWQHTLLCYVVRKSPSYYQFVKTVQRLWKCSSVEVFMRENGLFYYRFSCEEDLCHVIKDGPWYMEGKLIVVKKFGGATNCKEDMLSCIPIWVKLSYLPVQWWSISGVSKVVSPIGHPLYFDIPSASQSRIAYARCYVEVAMEKPLPDFVTCIGGDKVRRRQKNLYDWVPKKYSRCMAFGHLVVDCHEEKNQEMHKVQKGVNQGNVRKGGQQFGAPKSKVQKSDLGGSKENAKELMPMQIIVEHGGRAKSTIADEFLPCIEESPHGLSVASKGKHSYFCSDEDVAPSSVGTSQHLVSGDEGDTDNEGEKSEWDRMSCPSLEDPIGVGDVVGLSNLSCNKEEAGVEGNEIGNQGGVEPKNQEDDKAEMINNKKAKRTKKRPASVRPTGSRTTRHSGNTPML